MRVHVLAFATARDAIEADERTVELPEGTDVAGLRRRLLDEHPELDPIWERLAVAVDGELAEPGTVLGDGSEVALLPPVSGGATDTLTRSELDLDRLVAAVKGPECGAVVTFLGVVRDRHEGRGVLRLDYSAYEPMAAARLQRIVDELETRHEGARVRIVHRLGALGVGEASLAIAVASPHRRTAFAAARDALERVKREVPIWKHEHYADGSSRWREEEPLAPRDRSSLAPAERPGRRTTDIGEIDRGSR